MRVTQKVKTQLDAFLVKDCEEMAIDVSMTRKRSSASCESGQSTMTEGLGASAALSSAIADMILKVGLSHTLSEDPLMARVLKFAKVAPASYKPPTREDIGGRYLDTFSIRYEKKNDALVVEVSKKFGWSMMSDGATVLHIPLVNVLAGLPNVLPVMLEIADCTGHMQGGGKKDGMFLATLMQKHADKLPKRECYLYLLDGAGNEQAAGGDMLELANPWSTKIRFGVRSTSSTSPRELQDRNKGRQGARRAVRRARAGSLRMQDAAA